MKKDDVFQDSFEVNEAVYQGFLNTFNDHNPLHTNPDFAEKKGFPHVVMHGNILNGFLSYFIGEGLPTKDVMIISQAISFHNPFYLNDKIAFTAKIKDVTASVGVYNFKYRFTNEANKLIAKGTIQIKLLA